MKRAKPRRNVFDSLILENINHIGQYDFFDRITCMFCRMTFLQGHYYGHMRYHYISASAYLMQANTRRTNKRIYNYLMNERTVNTLMKIEKVK